MIDFFFGTNNKLLTYKKYIYKKYYSLILFNEKVLKLLGYRKI